ncbi:keratin, type I cytoskeletal 47 kDa-like [Bombina bombina]|uniref:keratin, type I cytoskeletal 47 kDa-like n=1 Tax=Bombina bombina TaxID=8345 RepID=UPI00235B2D08|nr:keratin, type I cytoskeletal 47 kDa-like [Bombina bombina]
MSFSSRSYVQSSRYGVAPKAFSVTGSSERVRMASASRSFSSVGAGYPEVSSFSINGKETMQNLNDRLGNYLERVRSLEHANSELEIKIKEFYDKKAAMGPRDLSGYIDTISKLRDQVTHLSMENAKKVLEIDNATLAADDFKMKFEAELAIRLGVDNDVIGLRRALDELTLNRSDLELELEGLKEELIFLKRNHEEELAAYKSQAGGTVNVEMNSAPDVDLSKILAEAREQYEQLAEKSRQEAETLYLQQCEPLYKEVECNTEAIHLSKTEITDLKRTVQSLEIELQSLMNMKQMLDSTLSETEARYSAQLVQHQAMISQIEAELQQVRSDSGRHSIEYSKLLDAKARLELEIATYRRLLDGEDLSMSQSTHNTQKAVAICTENTNTVTTVVRQRTMIEETVDGKVVSSSNTEVIQQS